MTSASLTPLTEAALSQAAALHALSFDPPWNEAALADLCHSGAQGLCRADSENTLHAFILWRAAADEAEILTLTTHPDQRRHGHAAALLMAAIKELQQQRITRLFLEVREDNIAAQTLYRRQGFEIFSRRSAYYSLADGTRRDAVLMQRRLYTETT